MPKSDVETYWEHDAWKNGVEDGNGAMSTHDTKDEAVAASREEAKRRQNEHIIRNQEGKLAERNSYGNHPRNVPG